MWSSLYRKIKFTGLRPTHAHLIGPLLGPLRGPLSGVAQNKGYNKIVLKQNIIYVWSSLERKIKVRTKTAI